MSCHTAYEKGKCWSLGEWGSCLCLVWAQFIVTWNYNYWCHRRWGVNLKQEMTSGAAKKNFFSTKGFSLSNIVNENTLRWSCMKKKMGVAGRMEKLSVMMLEIAAGRWPARQEGSSISCDNVNQSKNEFDLQVLIHTPPVFLCTGYWWEWRWMS